MQQLKAQQLKAQQLKAQQLSQTTQTAKAGVNEEGVVKAMKEYYDFSSLLEESNKNIALVQMTEEQFKLKILYGIVVNTVLSKATIPYYVAVYKEDRRMAVGYRNPLMGSVQFNGYVMDELDIESARREMYNVKNDDGRIVESVDHITLNVASNQRFFSILNILGDFFIELESPDCDELVMKGNIGEYRFNYRCFLSDIEKYNNRS